MERFKTTENELGPLEKGMDFVLHFSGRQFTKKDIADRYCCTLRQATRIFNYASRMMRIDPAGLEPLENKYYRFKWEIKT